MGALEELVTPMVRAGVARLPLLPGGRELIASAKQAGWKVGLATGHNRARLETKLAELGLLDEIDAIVTAAEVRRGKPAPDIFHEVADRLGVLPADCVVLEDSPPGCEAALSAGMSVIACPSVITRRLEFPTGMMS